MKKSQELQENFDKFKVNQTQQKNRKGYNRSEYRDSILVQPVQLKNLTKDYEKFDGLPGVDSNESDLEEYYHIHEDDTAEKLIQTGLYGKATYKNWAALISCSVLSSSLSPLMICMKESVSYKLFWMFIMVKIKRVMT